MTHWIFEKLPRVTPASWSLRERREDGVLYSQALTGLSVIVSGDIEQDGKKWIHLSIAHRDRMPTWDEVVDAKEWILGREEYAMQIIPPRERYVNQHPFCLHLWSCADGHPLPDFTRGGKAL